VVRVVEYKKLFFLGFSLLLMDQLTKFFARSLLDEIILIPSVLSLTYVKNTGAAFGILQGNNLLFIFLSFAALLFLFFFFNEFQEKKEKILVTLIITGVIGNLFDRLFFGFVTDFITFPYWPSFNIADALLSSSVLILLLFSFFSNKRASS